MTNRPDYRVTDAQYQALMNELAPFSERHPGVTFNIKRYDQFIFVDWLEGPPRTDVQAIVDRHNGGNSLWSADRYRRCRVCGEEWPELLDGSWQCFTTHKAAAA